jgi:hypothetical protein
MHSSVERRLTLQDQFVERGRKPLFHSVVSNQGILWPIANAGKGISLGGQIRIGSSERRRLEKPSTAHSLTYALFSAARFGRRKCLCSSSIRRHTGVSTGGIHIFSNESYG